MYKGKVKRCVDLRPGFIWAHNLSSVEAGYLPK